MKDVVQSQLRPPEYMTPGDVFGRVSVPTPDDERTYSSALALGAEVLMKARLLINCGSSLASWNLRAQDMPMLGFRTRASHELR